MFRDLKAALIIIVAVTGFTLSDGSSDAKNIYVYHLMRNAIDWVAGAGGTGFSVGGNVTLSGQSDHSGVTITFTRVSGAGVIPASVQTAATGAWGQSGFETGTTYRATPTKSGWSFTPAYSDFSSTATNLNFAGARGLTGIYWTDFIQEAVYRVNPDGSGRQAVYSGTMNSLDGLDVDNTNQKLYIGTSYNLLRSNLDGSGLETIFLGGNAFDVYGVAVDPAHGKVYWCTWAGSGGMRRANLDGSSVEAIVTGVTCYDIEVDSIGGKLYWSTSSNIRRSNLDGSGAQTLITASQTKIAVDTLHGKIYYAGHYDNDIRRANLDGSGIEVVVVCGGALYNAAADVEVDAAGGKIYWNEWGGGSDTVHRANLDGSQNQIVVSGNTHGNSLALAFSQPPIPQYSVSGSVTLSGQTDHSGVTITFTRVSGTGSIPTPVQTNSVGAWSQTGFETGTTYRATPTKSGWTFAPTYRDFNATATNLNFTGTSGTRFSASGTVTLSGQTNHAGVTVTFTKVSGTGLIPAAVQTTANGAWTQSGFETGTTYRATPTKSGWTFAPTYRDFNATATNLNFTGTSGTRFSASGTVTLSGQTNHAGVTVTFTKVSGTGLIPAAVQTTANGAWSQTGFETGTTYRATPTKFGWTFAPTYRDFSSAASNLSFSGSRPGAGTPKLYWTDWTNNCVWRANLDGTNQERILNVTINSLDGIAVDPVAKKLYIATSYHLLRTNLDGSGVETIIRSGNAFDVYGVTLDLNGRKVYWSTWSGSKGIRRANLDGSSVETIFSGSITYQSAIDPVGGKLYWASSAGVRRANLDGSNMQTVIGSIVADGGIALDVRNREVYFSTWNATGDQKIYRADLNGGNIQPLVSDVTATIALDGASGKMYWTSWAIAPADMRRANLDGTQQGPVCSLPGSSNSMAIYIPSQQSAAKDSWRLYK